MNSNDIEGNRGIIATTVTAEVLAVGENASATQSRLPIDLNQFRTALGELRDAVEALKLPENTKSTLRDHVGQLEHEAGKSSPDRGQIERLLGAIASSAKMLGEFVSNVTIVLGPVAKIAGLFGITLLL